MISVLKSTEDILIDAILNNSEELEESTDNDYGNEEDQDTGDKENRAIVSILKNDRLNSVKSYAIFTGENPFAMSFNLYGELVEKYDELICDKIIGENLNNREKRLWSELTDKDRLDIWKEWKKNYPDFKKSNNEEYSKGSFLISQISEDFDSENYRDEIIEVMKRDFVNKFLSYNKERNELLKKELSADGYVLYDVVGKYGSLENSIFVCNISREKVEELSNKFGQESYIYAELNKLGDGYTVISYKTVLSEKEKDRLLTEYINNPAYVIEEKLTYEQGNEVEQIIYLDKDTNDNFTEIKGGKNTKAFKFTYLFKEERNLSIFGIKRGIFEIMKTTMEGN